ncbi:MAG: hypothetical protein QOE87_3134 [Gaiellales bacterium]|nr:hypothetical protein [Gaiellales bacterium]
MHVVVAAIDSAYVREWADLLVRWLHVIAAIAWIGASFYFILLDNHLEPPKSAEDAEAGVAGELWEVHGGGFYHVQKYQVAPRTLPERLAWFKWEAYTTWLSGFALLCIVYFWNARAYLIDRSVADLTVPEAIALTVGFLVAGWLVYDVLCRLLGRAPKLLALALLGFIALAAYAAGQLFAPRAVFIVVGSMIGTMMAGNVLFVIIPGHWELIRAKQAGREPDPAHGIKGKLRSVHNNYLTLPVLLTMLGNHFPFVYGHDDAWLALCAFVVLGAYVRHFFNLRHRGRNAWSIPVTSALAVVGLAIWLAPPDEKAAPAAGAAGLAAGKRVFLTAGCAGCHTLADAGATGRVGPNLDAAKPSRELVINRVTNGQGAMPAFASKLSPQQIGQVADYVATRAGA